MKMPEVPGMGKLGYDRAIVTFSPDGRLFQVEYAREAVKRASTAVGITYEDGVVLATVKPRDELAVQTTINEKIQKIDDHIGTVAAGLLGDARVLTDKSRVKAQVHRITYDEPMDVPSLVKFVADFKQAHTQYAGLRPMGIAFLIGGMNDEPYLFETDQAGTIFQWKAHAIGRGEEKVKKFLDNNWKKSLSEEDALKMAIKALDKGEDDVDKEDVEIAVVNEDGYRKLDDDERKELLKNWNKDDKKKDKK